MCSLRQSFRHGLQSVEQPGGVARWAMAQWRCFSWLGWVTLWASINYTGQADGQLEARRGKIFSDVVLLQVIFKLLCFHCLIGQSAKYKQSPLPVLSCWCQGGEPEDVRTCSVMDNRTAGKGVEELLVMKGQYKMIFFYNIIWLELEGDEFEIELWCFYFFFFSPRRG